MAIFKIEPHEQYTLKGMLDYISDATVHDNQILFGSLYNEIAHLKN